MPVLLLLFLTFICYPSEWPAPGWTDNPWLSAFLAWLIVAFEIGLAALIAHDIRLRLADSSWSREAVLRRYARLRFVHLLTLLGSYVSAVWVLGWGWAVTHLSGTNPIQPGAGAFLRANAGVVVEGIWAV